MAFRGQVHRGTPVNHIRSGGAGIAPAKPRGVEGTQPAQYGSEKGGYRDAHVTGHGTAYNSEPGNPGDAMRGATDRYGKVISERGQDHNDPAANGSGTIFNGATQANGYTAKPDAPTLDSPVPRDAPVFDAGFIPREDAAHEGSGNEAGARDDLIKVGGVMSR